MRVLISAYSCETGRGSEGEIGWRLVHALSMSHQVTVIVRKNLKPIHDASFAITPKPENLEFYYFDLPWIFRFYKKGNRFFLLYYYLWQIGVGLRARRIIRNNPVDVVHHLIGGMDWMPSGLSLLSKNIPFVWGPIGSENTHPVILRHLSLRSRLKDRARRCTRWIMRTIDPFVRLTASRARIILSHTPETLPPRMLAKVHPCTQTGITDHVDIARPKADLSRSNVLRLIYAGELKDWKGARLALDSALLAFERGLEAQLVVIGDGDLRSEMESVAARHPYGGRVNFLGKVPMKRLIDELHDSDIMLYPSFHHGLATIVLQGMLTKLPIICIEGDAIGRAVGLEAGITVSLSIDEHPTEGLARAILDLDRDDELRIKLGLNARSIALELYNYDTLSNRISDFYSCVTDGGAIDISMK